MDARKLKSKKNSAKESSGETSTDYQRAAEHGGVAVEEALFDSGEFTVPIEERGTDGWLTDQQIRLVAGTPDRSRD